MARIFPAICPTTKGGIAIAPAERHLFARLARELDAGWQIIHDCDVRADGDSGALEFVLLHRDYGVALLGVAAPGEVEDLELAVAAMRATLKEMGFAQRYPGHLAIVARNVVPDAVSDLAAFLAVRFAAVPASVVADPTWPDWLVQRLLAERVGPERHTERAAPPGAISQERGLRGPTPEDSWRVRAAETPPRAAPIRGERTAGTPEARFTADRIPVSRVATTRSPLWTGMALAAVVVTVVLVGMAVLSHGNGPADPLATQSARSPLPAAPVAPAN